VPRGRADGDRRHQQGRHQVLGGAKLEVLLGDAQSTPQAGAAEIEKMNEAGCAAVVGAYARAICLATTQAAAKYNLPHVVDVGVADQIVERGLKNTFRFGPGYRTCAQVAVSNLHVLNALAAKPAKTVMIIHEESLFGTGTANLLAAELPGHGFEVKEIVKHANPTRDFNNIVLRMKALNPDIVIPANYYNEYALLVRTMQQQKVAPKAIYSVLGGAASSYKFVKEFPTRQRHHRLQPLVQPEGQAARRSAPRSEAKNLFFTYEIFNTYTAVRLLADALERAASTDRAAIVDALAKSTFSDHFMPYGATEFVNGQNAGAQPLMTQVIKGDIRVIVPRDYREADPIFPMRAT
jgi:branched-chain amino acid transport system substrate-binding protein